MPFKSKAQVRACFAQNDPNWNCHEWAKETESIKALPEKKKQRGVENAKTAGELSNMGQNKDECFDYIASLMQKLIDKQAFVPASQAPPQANNLTQQQNQLQGQLQSDASAPIPAPTALPAAKPGIQVAPVRAPMQQSITNNTLSKMAGFGDVVKANWKKYLLGGAAIGGTGAGIYNAYHPMAGPETASLTSQLRPLTDSKQPASLLAPLIGVGSGLLLSRLLLRKKKKEQPRPEVRTEIVERQPPQIYVPMPQISFAPVAMPKYAAYREPSVLAHIAGASGSGKTTLGRRIARLHPNLAVKDLDEFDDEAEQNLGYAGVSKRDYTTEMLSELAGRRQQLMDSFVSSSKSPVVFVGHHTEGDHVLRIPTENRFLLDVDARTSARRGYQRSQKGDPKYRRTLEELPQDEQEARETIDWLRNNGYQPLKKDHILRWIANRQKPDELLAAATSKAAFSLQDKVAKQSERSDTGKAKAVIIRGNATRDSDVSNSLYSGLHRYLKRRGFQVSEDAGEPYTLPDTTAKLWIGHSRGADRLAYAPDGIQTIAIGSRQPGAINHPEDVVDVEPEAYPQLPKQTRQAHQSWHPSFSQKLDELLAASTSKAAYSLQSMAMRDASLSRRKKKVEKQEEPDVEALPVLPTKIEVRKRKKPIVKQAAPGDMGVSYAQPKGYGSALPGQAQRQARAQRLSDARQSRKDRNLPMYASSWNVKKPVTTPAAPATAPAAPAPSPAAPTSMVQLAPRSQPTSPSQHVAMLAPTGSRMDYMDMNAGKQVTGVPKAAPGPVVASGPQLGGAFGSYAQKPQPVPAAPQQPVKAAPAPQPSAANQKILTELDGIEARLKALQSPNQVPGTPKPPVLQSGITNQPSAPATAPNRMAAGISTTQPGNPANLLRPQNILNSQAPAQPMDLRRSFAVRPQAPAATQPIQANPQLSSVMGVGPAQPSGNAAPAPNMQSGIASAAPRPAALTSTQGSASDPTGDDELMNQLKEFRLGRPMTADERDSEASLRAYQRRRTAENTRRQENAFNAFATKIPGQASSPTMSQLRDQVSQYLASTHGGSANAASISPLLDNNLMARATGQAAPNMQRGVSESNASPAAAVSSDEVLQRLRNSMNQLNTTMGAVRRAENADRIISSPETYNAILGRAPQAPSSASQAPPAAPQSYFDLLDQANSTERRVDQLAPSSSFLPETAGMAGSVINPMLAAGIGR